VPYLRSRTGYERYSEWARLSCSVIAIDGVGLMKLLAVPRGQLLKAVPLVYE